jgi:hypothetical protein
MRSECVVAGAVARAEKKTWPGRLPKIVEGDRSQEVHSLMHLGGAEYQKRRLVVDGVAGLPPKTGS